MKTDFFYVLSKNESITFLGQFNRFLLRGRTTFFVKNEPSYIDLKVFHFRSGVLSCF